MKTLPIRLGSLFLTTLGTVLASQPASLKDLPNPDPEIQIKDFIVPEGFEISLWASDPMLRKPVQMNWDEKGRLWVVSSTTYPQIKPGAENVDQVVVLEDTDNDGKADKSTVFAEDLHIPTAVIPADGGAYVANSTEIVFLKDTDGDGKADHREVLLSGFGTEDTHHLVHTFRHGPEGLFYFLQSIYIHSHLETPYGVRRLLGGGVWEMRTETRRAEVLSKGLVNPWGFEFNRWGQSFATDGAGGEGINYIFPGSVFLTSPGAKRILKGLNPGQPKHCGLEIIEDPHFPDDWQHSLITCDFRGNRINRFTLTENGSGYLSKKESDVLASNHRGFRPIDVRVGPDGALYIADWYNPIIQHGEVDFRDPRRDLVHGRIWKLSAKARPLSKSPEFAKLDVPQLLETLNSPRRWDRHFAKRELRNRDASEVVKAIQNTSTDANSHHALELAWALEAVNSHQPPTLVSLLTSKDHKIRAAALRILSHRLDAHPDALLWLDKAVQDSHPQVRLWALSVLDLIKKPEAIEIALKVLDHPMDENLDFQLERILSEQAPLWLPLFQNGTLKLTSNTSHLLYALKATGNPDALNPLIESLKKADLPQESADAIYDTLAKVATQSQLSQLLPFFTQDEFNARQSTLLSVFIAGAQRNQRPNADQEKLNGIISTALQSGKDDLIAKASQLAGFWKLESFRDQLVALSTGEKENLRGPAVQGLIQLGGDATRVFLVSLTENAENNALRSLAIRGLTSLDAQFAAQKTVEILTKLNSPESARPLFEAFLTNKELPLALAKALEGKTIPSSIAVEGVRLASSRGLQEGLEPALNAAGNIKPMSQALDAAAMAALVERVKNEGDAARGEAIYRRPQLTCFACHEIGEGGGSIGPNLVSLGASAPIDYIIDSLLDPNKQIKEGYHMTMVTTKSGAVYAGGIAEDGADRLVIRDAAGQLHAIQKSDIAQNQISPVSMMPPGLTASLREDEFMDLVKFMSELGREGDYKISPHRYIRSWRVLQPMPQTEVESIRHIGLEVLNAEDKSFAWAPAWSTVSGGLPLSELPQHATMHPWFPKVAQADIALAQEGSVTLKLENPQGMTLLIGKQKFENPTENITVKLPAGKHLLTVVATRASTAADIKVEIIEGAAQVVTGK